MNILSIQAEDSVVKEAPKKVNLGEVLELAVQSMSVTMAEEEMEEKATAPTQNSTSMFTDGKNLNHRNSYDSNEDQESDFEWKLDNEDETVSHSPPTKKKKLNLNTIVPTVKTNLFNYSFFSYLNKQINK